MQTERGWFIGPGDKVLFCDSAGKITFTTTDMTDAELLEATPIPGDTKGRCDVRPVAHPDLYVSADATLFTPTGNVCQQYYGAFADQVVGPDGLPGFYQRWCFGQWSFGLVTAAVLYDEQGADHGRAWMAAGLTWIKQ